VFAPRFYVVDVIPLKKQCFSSWVRSNP